MKDASECESGLRGGAVVGNSVDWFRPLLAQPHSLGSRGKFKYVLSARQLVLTVVAHVTEPAFAESDEWFRLIEYGANIAAEAFDCAGCVLAAGEHFTSHLLYR